MKEEKNEIHRKIDRYLDNLYTREEANSLLEELPQKEQLDYLEACSMKMWEESLEADRSVNLTDETSRREAIHLLQSLRKKTYSIRPLLRIAACLTLVALAGWGVLYMGNSRSQEVAELQEMYVAYGDKKELKLSDGTIVILNSGTRIKYPVRFEGAERLVELSGEAFFSVAKDAEHPFIVATPQLQLKVLGTEFNIKVYDQDERAAVSVKSGKVEVETEEVVSRLIAGEQIQINTLTRDYRKEREDFNNISSWIKGGLFFNEAPIGDVVKELNRIYNCTIRFEEGQSFDNLIVGEHDNKSIESVLKSIEYTTGIKYRKEGAVFVLYKE